MNDLIKIEQAITKETVKDVSQFYIDKIVNGEVSPLAAHLQLKLLTDVIENIKKDEDVINAVLNEADSYRNQKFMGFYPKVSERKNYEFNDTKLTDYNKELDVIKAKIKDREDFLKAVKEPVIDPDTGELIEPVDWRSKRYIVWSLK